MTSSTSMGISSPGRSPSGPDADSAVSRRASPPLRISCSFPTPCDERPSGGAFPRPVKIVMNVPHEEAIQEEQDPGFTLFNGGNLGPDRCLLEASEAVRGMEGVTFRIAGTGDLEEPLRSGAERSPEVEFLGQIDHRRLLRETARAHAILAWYDPSVPADRVASPNKLFDAMMLSRPVIVISETFVAELVSEIGGGLVVPYADEGALQQAVGCLRDDAGYVYSLGATGRRAFESTYNWKINEQRLRESFSAILPRSNDRARLEGP